MNTPTYLNRCAYILAGATLLASPAALAADAAWNVNALGNWSLGSNWNPASSPGATSGTTNQDTATFSSSVVTAARTVTVDDGRNIKNITVNVNGQTGNYTSYSITGVGNSLLLTSGGTLLVTGATNVSGTGAFTTAAVAPTSMILQGNYTFSVDTTTTAGKYGQFFIGSAATVSGASGLGNVTLTLSGQTVLNTTNAVGDQIAGTAGGVFNGAIVDGTGNTLSVVKEGAGAWQFTKADTFSGGLTIKQGTISMTNNAGLGTSGVTLGESGSANSAALLLGSGVNVANSLTVNNGTGLRTLGGNNGTTDVTYSGTITLNSGANLRIQKASSKNVIIGNGITGTGNVEAYDNSTTAATGIVFTGAAINNVGTVTNSSPGVGTLTQTAGGVIGSNVTEFIQNSATSTTTLSLVNSYNKTTILAGTVVVASGATLGTGDVTVSGSGALTLNSNISLSDTATLRFVSSGTATITLNNTTSDTVYAIFNTTTNTYANRTGVWTANDLNLYYGTAAFAGTGTLTVVAVPEPSTVGMALFALGVVVITQIRRRARAAR